MQNAKVFQPLTHPHYFFFQKNAIKNQRVVYYAWILLNFVVEIYGHGYIHVYMYMLHKQSGWVAFMQMDCRQIQQKATSSTSSQLVQQKFKPVYWLLFFPIYILYILLSILFLGHSQSWGKSIKDLLTKCYSGSKPNGQYGPIDPSLESSYGFLAKFFAEIGKVFPDHYVHLGGDEVNFDCWCVPKKNFFIFFFRLIKRVCLFSESFIISFTALQEIW